MRWYVARRVMWAFVVTFIIISITWGLITVTPNQEVQQAAQTAAQQGEDPELARQQARKRLGLDRPLTERYADYMVDAFTFQWGYSDSRSQQVTTAMLDAMYYTAQYSVPWTILTIVFGIVAGLYSANNQYSKRDNIATFLAFFGYSIPNFWFGIMLLLVFGVYLDWVPILYNPDAPLFSVENAKQHALPVFVLVTGSVGGLHRIVRNESAEYLNVDFVKTARAKGASGRRILSRHIFRPASVPISTTLVDQLLLVFLGQSVLIEQVFQIPGLGRLALSAITSQDLQLLLGTTFVFVFIAVIGNLLQDLAYTVLDPRIDFGDH